MKKLYNKVLIILTLLLSFYSCDDYFELDRTQEASWTTTQTFEEGLSSVYATIFYKGYMTDITKGAYVYMDYITSGTAQLLAGCNTSSDVYYRRFTDNLMDSYWNYGYQIVTMCNLAIDLDKEGDGNPLGLDITGDDYKNNYLRQVAEYYFCRAWAYFYLAKTYAPPYNHNGSNDALSIPLKTSAAYSSEDVENEKPGTVQEVYDQIISDLQYAKENLPEKFILTDWSKVSGYECGRANKMVATSLLGKVYFLMGKYTEAMAEFDDVIEYAESTGTYQLEDPKEPFNKVYATDVPKESIWEFNTGDLSASEGHNGYFYSAMIMGFRFRTSNNDALENNSSLIISGWNAFSISYSALKEMGWMVDPLNGDYTVTDEAEADLRYQQVYHHMLPYETGITTWDPKYITTESVSSHSLVATPQVYVDKFFRGEAPYGRYTKFPFIRLADIYLLRAWTRWNADDLQGAADDLNIIWNRSHSTNQNYYTTENINHQAIYKEYLREMMCEGWTVDFMMGTQMDIPAGDDPLNTSVESPYDEWYWPIPINEVNLNPNY